MAIDYAALAATAQRLIDANGRTLTITLRPRAATDPTKPWNGPAVSQSKSIDVIGVIGDDVEADPKGGLVRVGTMSAYIAAADTDPALVEQYDVLTDGLNTWKILKVQIIGPGSTRVLYQLKLGA